MTQSTAQGWRTPLIVFLSGCLLLFLSFGTRQGFGLFLQPISADFGWGREVFALSIAIQNLVVGAAQPFTSAIADRYGTGRLVALGGVLYALGLYLMANASSPVDAYLSMGVLVGLGLSGTSFAIVFSSIARIVPPERRTFALGAGSSIGSLGTFTMVPLGQAFLDAYGWVTVLTMLSFVILLTVPVGFVLKGKPAETASKQSLGEALREARGHRGYRLLVAGFFVCGFHVAYIATHLPSYIVDRGLPAELGAWTLGLVGLFNVVGALGGGYLGDKISKRYLLSALYFGRAVLFTVFVFTPLTETTVLLFGVIMGLLWLSTVPVTSALVAQIFGPRYMATLFGIVFFSHQIGGFLGAWLGGYLFDTTGSYDLVWYISIALGLASSALHLPIDEKPVSRLATAE
jgi:predicted MFS family arabinose efflux permease